MEVMGSITTFYVCEDGETWTQVEDVSWEHFTQMPVRCAVTVLCRSWQPPYHYDVDPALLVDAQVYALTDGVQ